jgi:hypothetical protein
MEGKPTDYPTNRLPLLPHVQDLDGDILGAEHFCYQMLEQSGGGQMPKKSNKRGKLFCCLQRGELICQTWCGVGIASALVMNSAGVRAPRGVHWAQL